MSKKGQAVAPQTHKVLMEAEVARQVRQHSRTSMKTEVCGVLIGKEEGRVTIVEACIAGANATQGGAHVTFTQDTWEHIYQIKDEKYPNDRIVGWYHSHPGFGVFLSDHDLFIHEHFFSSPQQIAWVYDPHNDEEGCFGWHDGKIEKIDDVAFRYGQPCGESLTGEAEEDSDAEPTIRVKGDWKQEWKLMLRDALVCMLFFGLGTIAMYYWIGTKALLFPKGGQALVIVNNDELLVVPPEIANRVLSILQSEMEARMGVRSPATTQQAPNPNGTQEGGQDVRKK